MLIPWNFDKLTSFKIPLQIPFRNIYYSIFPTKSHLHSFSISAADKKQAPLIQFNKSFNLPSHRSSKRTPLRRRRRHRCRGNMLPTSPSDDITLLPSPPLPPFAANPSRNYMHAISIFSQSPHPHACCLFTPTPMSNACYVSQSERRSHSAFTLYVAKSSNTTTTTTQQQQQQYQNNINNKR